MTELTHDTAKGYVTTILAKWGMRFEIINATTIHTDQGDMIDVTFTKAHAGEMLPQHHIFSVWLEPTGELYGEW